MAITDRWHKSRPSDHEPRCPEHDLVPTDVHGKGHRWQVRYRDDTGRQRKQNFPKKLGKDPSTCASAFEAKIRDQLNTDTYLDPDNGKIAFRAYATQWREALTLDQVSLENIDSRFKVHVYPLIGDQMIGTLAKRPSLVQAWIKRMEKELGLSPTTIRDTVGWVSAVFAAAVDDSIVAKNPCQAGSIRRPKVVPKRAVPWTLERVEAVSDALPDDLAALPFLGAGCGLRQGELFGIAVDDVDFLGRTLRVDRQVRIVDRRLVFRFPKGGKTRTVSLPDAVSLCLAAHIKQHPPITVTLPWHTPDGVPTTVKLLFTNGRAGVWERNRFSSLWHAAREKAGAPGGRENGLHVLRHTAASAWLAQGVDIRTVAEFLGHSDPAFTLRVYSHLMPDAADRARKAMDAFFNPGDAESALGVPSGGA